MRKKLLAGMLAFAMAAGSVLGGVSPSSSVLAAETATVEIDENLKKAEPTTTKYDFEGENAGVVFQNGTGAGKGRVTISVDTDDTWNSNFIKFLHGKDAGNGEYMFAYYDFSSLVKDAAKTTVEFDYWYKKQSFEMLTLGDSTVRGTTQAKYKDDITTAAKGAVFNVGENRVNSSTSKSRVNNETCANTFSEQWVHVKVDVDEIKNTCDYVITTADAAKTELASGKNIAFLSDEAQNLTQIDVSGWASSVVGCKIDNLSITVEKSELAKHTVTVNVQDSEGNKIESMSSPVELFDGASFTPTYDQTFNLDGYKYTYDSGAKTIDSVTKDEEITLVYNKRPLDTTTVTVKLMSGDTKLGDDISKEVVEDSKIDIVYPKYIMKDNGIIYTTPNNGSGIYYGHSFTGTREAQDLTIEYTAESRKGIFFIEGEDLGEDSNAENANVRCSNGAAYKVPAEAVNVVSLGKGTYTVEAAVIGGREGKNNDTYTIKAGETKVLELTTTGSLVTKESDEFTLTEETKITVSGTATNRTGLDYILIRDLTPVPVTGITLDKTEVSLTKAMTSTTLTATIAPEDADEKGVTWALAEGDDELVTLVDNEDGTATITAKPEVQGTATVTVTSKESTEGDPITASCTVSVDTTNTATTILVNQITIDTPEDLTAENATTTLVATVLPENATNKTVTWSVAEDDQAIVSVNSTTGEVTALSNGTATVTATATDGSGITGTVEVTVAISTTPILEKSITLNKETLSLTGVGDTETLEVTFTPSNTTNKDITWTSSDTGVATVSNSGVVKSVTEGTTIITATTVNGKEATCTVTVTIPPEPVDPTGVTLNTETVTLTRKDETNTLTATVTPTNATDKSLTWTSSDETIATVADGVVTAVANGTATITVKTVNNKTATCTVKVEIVTGTDPDPSETPEETFNAYKAELLEQIESLESDENSDEVNALIAAAKAELNAMAIEESDDLEAIKAAATQIVTKLKDDIEGIASGKTDEQRFEEYKTTAVQTANRMIADEDSDAVIELVQTAIAAIQGTAFDEDKPLNQNRDVIDGILNQLEIDVTAQRTYEQNVKAFDAHKAQAVINANALAQNGDSAAVKQLIADAVANINAAKYNTAQTLDANKAAIDKIVADLKTAVAAQREKDKPPVVETPKVGDTFVSGGATYKITAVGKNPAVTMTKAPNTKKVTINTVTYKNVSYKVTAIGAKAGQKNNKIETLSIGNNVKTIGNSAFTTCAKLKTVTIGNGVTTIGSSAFASCKKLKTVTLGTGVKKISAKAFNGDSKLATITVKSTKVTSVGKNAFKGTAQKAKFTFPKKKYSNYKTKVFKNKGQNKKATYKKGK